MDAVILSSERSHILHADGKHNEPQREGVWAGLHIALFLNTRPELVKGVGSHAYPVASKSCAGLLHGDKDTWWIGMLLAGTTTKRNSSRYYEVYSSCIRYIALTSTTLLAGVEETARGDRSLSTFGGATAP